MSEKAGYKLVAHASVILTQKILNIFILHTIILPHSRSSPNDTFLLLAPLETTDHPQRYDVLPVQLFEPEEKNRHIWFHLLGKAAEDV
jgi:hypothetical protein